MVFGAKKSTARTPEGARLAAIGDIHGCADKLQSLLANIAADDGAKGMPSRLIFLGDYVDRGPDSRAVVERLIHIAKERPDAVFLKGNHEDVFLKFLNKPEENKEWLGWGGIETLWSYGVETPDERDALGIAEAARRLIPKSHVDFLTSLELYRVFGEYLFVHAGVRPGVPLEKQDENDLLWIRGEFHHAPPEKRPAEVVVHGHQPIRKPLDAGWRIDVDTGACFGGPLTAVVIEGESRRFLTS